MISQKLQWRIEWDIGLWKNNTGEKNTPNYISYLSIYELYKNKLNNI